MTGGRKYFNINTLLKYRGCRVPHPCRARIWRDRVGDFSPRMDLAGAPPLSRRRRDRVGCASLQYPPNCVYRPSGAFGIKALPTGALPALHHFQLLSPRSLDTPGARRTFELTLERVRRWYHFSVAGFVVMPKHVHLLVTEPQRAKLSVAIQMLKQNVAGKPQRRRPFWQARYYDFNFWSQRSRNSGPLSRRNLLNRHLLARSQGTRA